MRISDWSSDVCSSDLDRKSESGSAEVAPRMAVLRRHLHDAVPLDQAATDAGISLRTARRWLARYRADGPAGLARPTRPIGRASGRDRGCAYVYISVGAVSLTKKNGTRK